MYTIGNKSILKNRKLIQASYTVRLGRGILYRTNLCCDTFSWGEGAHMFSSFFAVLEERHLPYCLRPLEPVLACYKRMDVCSWTMVGGCRLSANIYTPSCLLILLRIPNIRNHEFIMIFMIRRIQAILWKTVYKSNYSQKEVHVHVVRCTYSCTLLSVQWYDYITKEVTTQVGINN